MSKSIKLSSKHGVNPSLTCCPICGKETGLALLGKLKGDIEAPKHIYDTKLCDECSKIIENGGHFFIEVRDGESGNNQYRTGRLTAITNEAAERIFTIRPVPPVSYIEHSMFESIFGEALREQNKEA